jgi:hypothetical protein
VNRSLAGCQKLHSGIQPGAPSTTDKNSISDQAFTKGVILDFQSAIKRFEKTSTFIQALQIWGNHCHGLNGGRSARADIDLRP